MRVKAGKGLMLAGIIFAGMSEEEKIVSLGALIDATAEVSNKDIDAVIDEVRETIKRVREVTD